MVKLLSTFAPAKLNLFLRVTGRRPDGYHELDSLFVPITLGDRLSLELRPSSRRRASLRGSFGNLPPDERNLAVRAALDFMAEFAVSAEVLIDLHKHIPTGAGLGGGSSDAAAVLRMMARLCGGRRGLDASRLARLALAIGADVPFFLAAAPARVTGIGERIAPVGPMQPLAMVVAVPPLEVPTAAVYRALKPEHWSGPAADADLRDLVAGRIAPRLMVNDLAAVAMAQWPEIARLKARLEELGAVAAAMTGSGAGVFGVYASIAAAAAAAAALAASDPAVAACAVGIHEG